IYYWFPKATGKMLDERLGQFHFWLFLFGFHMTFDTLHLAGLAGMPRRIYTYQPGRGFEQLNLIASIGVILQALGVLAFVYNVIRSLVAANWGGWGTWGCLACEWCTTSTTSQSHF